MTTIDEKLREAAAMRQAGDLRRAEQVCRKIVQAEPECGAAVPEKVRRRSGVLEEVVVAQPGGARAAARGTNALLSEEPFFFKFRVWAPPPVTRGEAPRTWPRTRSGRRRWPGPAALGVGPPRRSRNRRTPGGR